MLYWFRKKKLGELIDWAERKEPPSTLIPDLDNANVGTGHNDVWETLWHLPFFCVSYNQTRAFYNQQMHTLQLRVNESS